MLVQEIRRRPVRRLARALLDLLDAWAFGRLDARARGHGWQVRRPAPLMRVYRTSAVLIHASCRPCGGEGMTRAGVCSDCLGSGRGRPC